MVKELLNKKNLLVWSSCLIVVGLALMIAGFSVAKNDIQNFKVSDKEIWYQTVHVDEDGQFRIYAKLGPVYIFHFGDDIR